MSRQQARAAAPVGITMGCPVGIGPEIIISAWQTCSRTLATPPVIIGDRAVLAATARQLGLHVPIADWQPGRPPQPDVLNVLTASSLDPDTLRAGQPNRATGLAMAGYIDTAISLCTEGLLDAIATGPISKAALNLAGYPFPGHTEMLAARTGAERVAMMLTGSRLRVVLVTIHCALADVVPSLTGASIIELITLTDRALRTDFGIDKPRIAVAGLNPHGGEGGMFGREEIDIIAPAVRHCARLGITVDGPFPPDTVFHQAASGRFDVVVCMYHDQGLIPFKLLHFHDGVNVTLGLPIIRTSVDHGTAYDIAGRGVADHHSLEHAVALAAELAENRRRSTERASATPSDKQGVS
jgi:4-hydroxythreonine-4-phosphate dehydrogenase